MEARKKIKREERWMLKTYGKGGNNWGRLRKLEEDMRLKTVEKMENYDEKRLMVGKLSPREVELNGKGIMKLIGS